MEPPHKPAGGGHLYTNLFFLFLLLSTNLLTLFLSSAYFNSSCSSLLPSLIRTRTSSSAIAVPETTSDTAGEDDLPPEFLAFTSG